jgi:site-specific recombinase XerD
VVFRVLATIQGKQLKRIVPTRDAAELLAANWRDGQANNLIFLPTRLGPDQLRDAEAAQRILNTLGISLLDAATFALRNYKDGAASVPSLNEGIEQFLAARTDRSPSHQKSLRNTLHRLRDFIMKRDLGLVETSDISAWLGMITVGRAPKTWNTLLENIESFFSWCVEKGWLLATPVRGIEKKKLSRSMPVVLTPEHAAALMADLELTRPSYVPYYALALFGAVRSGVREGECSRLDHALLNGESPITGGGIKIRGKTGSERIVRWSTPLKAWLDAYPLNGRLLPDGEHSADAVIRAVRQKHGLHRNVLRHTGITGMALVTDSLVETAIACDTSETMIRKHYLGQWTHEQALRFYEIRPTRSKNGTGSP